MAERQLQYQVKTEAPLSTFDATSKWLYAWSLPVRTRAINVALMAPAFFFVQASFPENITSDKWFAPLSEPVRVKPGLSAATQRAYFAEPFGQTQPERVSEDKWHQPWSEPVRVKPAALAGNQQAAFLNPSPPFVSFSYFNPLSEPVRLKVGLNVSLHQTETHGTQPIIPATSWYASFSEPVRFKIGLAQYLHPAFTVDANLAPSTANLIEGWYNWLAEPVRSRLGLSAQCQQTLAWEPRLLPKPNVTATLAASGLVNKTALIGINVYNAVTPLPSGSGANVSIEEIVAGQNAPTSLRG